MSELTFSPGVATTVFVLACWAGYQYRRIWRAEGDAWKLWIYGALAGSCLLALGFVPIEAQ